MQLVCFDFMFACIGFCLVTGKNVKLRVENYVLNTRFSLFNFSI